MTVTCSTGNEYCQCAARYIYPNTPLNWNVWTEYKVKERTKRMDCHWKAEKN